MGLRSIPPLLRPEISRYLLEQTGAYVLMDSWYTNPGVLDACLEKGCHLISAMKANRILFPEGKRTSASDLTAPLDPGCFHPVTGKAVVFEISFGRFVESSFSKYIMIEGKGQPTEPATPPHQNRPV